MSLQALNHEFQLELMETKRHHKPHHHMMSKLKLDNFGGLFRREFPNSSRLEEILVGFD
jgi:sterol desaturase/sphingolipid hydroxylase (fatty acid hydroxylase superfamily)